MGFDLRPYQVDAIQGIRDEFRAGRPKVLFVLSTGGGKTVIVSFMAATAAMKGQSAYFICHREELISQASRTFTAAGIDHGLISPAHRFLPHKPVQVASINTLVNRIDKLPAPNLLMVDEAHHSKAAMWAKVFAAWPRAYTVGLTATPCRLDGQGLGDEYGAMVLGPAMRDLIRDGFLSDYKVFAPPMDVDLKGIRKRAGDFAANDLAEAVDKPHLIGDVIAHYKRLAMGKRAIVFCVNIKHSEHVAAEFNAAGIRAAHVDGSIDKSARRARIADFAAGRIDVLTNADLISEGFDVPACEAAVLLRPTQSLSLHLQQCGRALRPAPGKTHALILDHAGNTLRHGLPDEHREWTLDGAPRRARAGTAEAAFAVRQCPICYACAPPAATCPSCGHRFEARPREIRVGDGDLQELTKEARKAAAEQEKKAAKVRRLREEYGCGSYQEMVALAIRRGYQSPERWAGMRWKTIRSRRKQGRAA